MRMLTISLTLFCASLLRAQRPASHPTAADSAAVFNAIVDRLISDDSASAAQAAADPSFNELTKFPNVFVRIASMPKGDWAKAGVARLRAHRWFYGGRAMDSTRALAQRRAVRGLGFKTTPFPAELSLALHFTEHPDTAFVSEYSGWNRCEEAPGLLGVFFHRHLLTRTTDGWRWVANLGGGTLDTMCR